MEKELKQYWAPDKQLGDHVSCSFRSPKQLFLHIYWYMLVSYWFLLPYSTKLDLLPINLIIQTTQCLNVLLALLAISACDWESENNAGENMVMNQTEPAQSTWPRDINSADSTALRGPEPAGDSQSRWLPARQCMSSTGTSGFMNGYMAYPQRMAAQELIALWGVSKVIPHTSTATQNDTAKGKV